MTAKKIEITRKEARRLWIERLEDITEANRRFDEQVDAAEREREQRGA